MIIYFYCVYITVFVTYLSAGQSKNIQATKTTIKTKSHGRHRPADVRAAERRSAGGENQLKRHKTTTTARLLETSGCRSHDHTSSRREGGGETFIYTRRPRCLTSEFHNDPGELDD